MHGYLFLFIPVLILPQVENSSKIKQALKFNLITYTHGFASGVYLFPYSPQFPLHYETLLPPLANVLWVESLTFQHDIRDR